MQQEFKNIFFYKLIQIDIKLLHRTRRTLQYETESRRPTARVAEKLLSGIFLFIFEG